MNYLLIYTFNKKRKSLLIVLLHAYLNCNSNTLEDKLTNEYRK